MEFEQKVLQTIKKYNLINENDKIVVGVSGGPDSMCLLDYLLCNRDKLKIEIVVAHINHMIRKEADEETKYVEQYCKNNNIKCYVKKVDVKKIAKDEKLGTEETGRKIRYDFFEEIALKMGANKIATAHTANDNAETVIMNILRGSGTSGLKGIEVSRKNEIKDENKDGLTNNYNIVFIRPLREVTRQEIEQYCKKRDLCPKIDKSNFENIYTRNKIRNELIPYLQKEFNPNIIQGLNRLSDLAKEDDEYFKEIVCKEYERLKLGENEKEITLDLNEFNKLNKVIKQRLVLYTINMKTGTTQGIQKVNIEDIIKLCENNIGNKYLTPNKKIKIFINKGKIFYIVGDF